MGMKVKVIIELPKVFSKYSSGFLTFLKVFQKTKFLDYFRPQIKLKFKVLDCIITLNRYCKTTENKVLSIRKL